ncbi:MAG: hypothetical protein FDW93_03440 [Bergeyella sp.]|nr:hypothetical protein [Bergeyella sp.]
MTDPDILLFEQLKKEIEAEFLKSHSPSENKISKWKGVDILYFQEDLRRVAKGSISEKSFYNYFKQSPVPKCPRIDMLNLLSIYAGYESWSHFRKKHKEKFEIPSDSTGKYADEENSLQKTERHTPPFLEKAPTRDRKRKKFLGTNYFLITFLFALSTLVGVGAILLSLKEEIFGRTFVYCFSDADRSSGILSEIEIKVFKKDESPITYKIKPGKCFTYKTKDPSLEMNISSAFYENLRIYRNLTSAPKEETIELKPDDYKFAVYYFSKKDVSGNQRKVIEKKRKELDRLISHDANIVQVYDNEIYGVETLNKQKYITLVTTPTTSLKNLSVLEMKRNDRGKIIFIKFKISDNEKKHN